MRRLPVPLSLIPVLLAATLAAQTPPSAPTTAIPPGANLTDPQVLLSLAIPANSLDGPKATPWHLKASYETFDDSGARQDTGNFDEWYIAANHWKRTYTATHYTQTEYATAEGRFFATDSDGPPFPVSLVSEELIHPMTGHAASMGNTPEYRAVELQSNKFGCVMISQPLKRGRWPIGIFPTYCFASGSIMLRFEIFDGGIQAVRNDMAVFHGSYVAKDILLKRENKLLLRIHLLDISSMAPDDVASIAFPTNGLRPRQTYPILQGVMAGRKVSGSDPEYTDEARSKRIEGPVLLHVRIGTDGHIHDARVIYSPDETLSRASLGAIEQWVYKPYLLLGKPVNVETTITVVFSLK